MKFERPKRPPMTRQRKLKRTGSTINLSATPGKVKVVLGVGGGDKNDPNS
jgi:hypothetical protein